MYSLATVYSLFGIPNMSALNLVFVMAKICSYYVEISPTMLALCLMLFCPYNGHNYDSIVNAGPATIDVM